MNALWTIVLAAVALFVPPAVAGEGPDVRSGADPAPAAPATATPATTPEIAVAPEVPSEPRTLDELETLIRTRVAGVEGRWSVWFRDLRTGETMEIDPLRRYDAASIMKIPVMAKVFSDIERRRYRLRSRLRVKTTFPSAKEGGGDFETPAKVDEMEVAIGKRMRVDELLHYMIVESDNLATNILMQKAGGPDAVQRFAEKHGMKRSRIDRYLMDKPALEAGRVNRATAREYGELLTQLWNGELVSPAAARHMFEIMSGLKRWWIASRVPRRVRVAHKTGAVRGVRHDVGIFVSPGGSAWVLCVLSDRVVDIKAGQEALSDVSRAVWRWMRAGERGERAAPSADGDQDEPGVALVETNTFERARLAADTGALGAAFTAAGYRAPRGAMVAAARVEPGVGQPALRVFSLDDTGFAPSRGRFHPASTVKVMACVGALRTLGRHGVTGAARLRFRDGQGSWDGQGLELCRRAIVKSSNPAYNHLVAVAGLDELNGEYFVAEAGFPNTCIQVGYGKKLRGQRLEQSPEVEFEEGDKSGVIPARAGELRDEACPRKNCSSLFELLDALRRVVLHGELPLEGRFPIADADAAAVAGYLLEATDRLSPEAAEVLGEESRIYNKVGYIPGADLLETALLEAADGRRYLLAARVPFPGTKEDMPKAREALAALARESLRAVAGAAEPGPPLQPDAGVPLDVVIEPGADEPRRVVIRLRAEGTDAAEAELAEGWVGSTALPRVPVVGGSASWEHRFEEAGDRVLVLRLLRGDRPVGHRSLVVRVADEDTGEME